MIAKRVFRYLFPALLGAAGLAGCSGEGQPAAASPTTRPPMPVTVLEVQPRQIPVAVEVMAQAEGARETQVRARVGGILLEHLYTEGQTVSPGQPLFQLDPATYEIALADAKARAEQAARERKRIEGLVKTKAVSRRDYDNAVSADAIAQAALRQAELNLSWTTIRAPVGGATGRALKSEGNLISAGADLLTSIYQSDPIWVRFSLGQSDLAKVPGGRLTSERITGVELILPDGSVYPRRGKVNFLASNIDPTLGTRQLRAEFPNPEGELLPGQFVRVRLLLGERDGIFLVPQQAVMQTQKGHSVMVADADDKAAPRPVQVGDWRGTEWIILGGLAAGDRVIVDNLIKLRPGMMVKPEPSETPKAVADRNRATETAHDDQG